MRLTGEDRERLRADLIAEIAKHPGITYPDLQDLATSGYPISIKSVCMTLAEMTEAGEIQRVRATVGGRASYRCFPKGYEPPRPWSEGKLSAIRRPRKARPPGELPMITVETHMDQSGPVSEETWQTMELPDDEGDTPSPPERLESRVLDVVDVTGGPKQAVMAVPYGDGKVWQGTVQEAIDLYQQLRVFEYLK